MPDYVDDRSITTVPPRRSNRTIALLLVGIGALLLIDQIGVLGDALWSVLLPVGLIAFGLDLVTRGTQRRRIGLSALLALIVLTPLVGVGQWFDRAHEAAEGEAQRFALPGIERVRADVELTAGELSIGTLDDDSADQLRLDGNGRFTRRSQDGNVGIAEIRPAQPGGDVDLLVMPNVPLDLTITMSVGSADDLDFTGTRLETLNLTMTAGDAHVRLPDQGVIDVAINGSIGEIDVAIPDDLPARIEIASSLGEADLDDRFEQTADGVYQTAGYSETAPNRATIRIAATVSDVTIE